MYNKLVEIKFFLARKIIYNCCNTTNYNLLSGYAVVNKHQSVLCILLADTIFLENKPFRITLYNVKITRRALLASVVHKNF